MNQLLDAIYANLEDDAPRLVYADALQDAGDPRGEFIAVQCELARLGYAVKPASWDWIGDALADDDVDPVHIRKLRSREKALLTAHGDSWLADVRKVNPDFTLRSLRFERGFLAHYQTGAAAGLPNKLSKLQAALPTLESLDMPSMIREHIGEAFTWPGFAMLRVLTMPMFGVEALVGLASAKLRDLSLRCTDRADSPSSRRLFDWAPFKGITALELSGAPVTAADAGTLVATCGPLDELQLRGGKLGAPGATALGKAKALANLRILSVLGNAIGPEGTRALMSLKKLRALDLRKNRIGTAGAEALGGHPALRMIDLTGNTMTAETMEALCGGGGLGELRELCLQATHVDDDGLAILAKSPLLGRLTTLKLRSNMVTDAGAKALAKSKHATSLRSLNLNNNEITAAGKQLLDDSKYLENARIALR